MKKSRAKHEVEVHEIETKANKDLEELRVDIVRFFPERILDVIVQDIIGNFSKLREK